MASPPPERRFLATTVTSFSVFSLFSVTLISSLLKGSTCAFVPTKLMRSLFLAGLLTFME